MIHVTERAREMLKETLDDMLGVFSPSGLVWATELGVTLSGGRHDVA